ncbi:hypothetical protein [Carnobacterium maltaromaticum]|uniref:hypothetical protein n=1 Tax=Carnobacterium maltaromaticum TaxID=2751 RepID=UPI00070528B7|nr:hypothetical protein [Carnobacterium maltaromaticum]AOA03996.1 hypothetical protein BFC23_16745 [Carnobacterium maltaromaticum]MBC9810418.1 hypothetical protein [Carnobacterium maltaromaticum]GED49923.1 hypothetical protein CMA01_23330 [Carnobacterium maltaromaticum]
MDIKINGKELILQNDKKIVFNYQIKNVEMLNDRVVILLKTPFNNNAIDSIIAISLEGRLIWKIKNPDYIKLPYEKMSIKNGIILATDFYGNQLCINSYNGNVIK